MPELILSVSSEGFGKYAIAQRKLAVPPVPEPPGPIAQFVTGLHSWSSISAALQDQPLCAWN